MTKVETKLQSLLAGTQKNIPATSMVDVNGQQLKQPDIVAKLQGWIQTLESKDAAKGSYNTALLAVEAVLPDISQFGLSYGRALKQVLGENSPLLAEFGLSTVPRKVTTAQTRVVAQAKGSETRKARGTMSRKQKLAIKGPGVTSVTVPGDGSDVVVAVPSQGSGTASSAGAVAPDPVGAATPGPAPNPGK